MRMRFHLSLCLAVMAGVLCACAGSPAFDRMHWVTLWRQEERRPRRMYSYTMFLDTLASRRVGTGSYEIWAFLDFDSVQVDSSGLRYRTLALRRRINCDSSTMIAIERLRFDSTLRKPVQRFVDPEAHNGPDVPPSGSVGHSLWKGSCSTLRHEPWEFAP